MNWVDVLIILILIFNVVAGFEKDFISVLFGLVFFALGLAAAIRFYPNAAFVLFHYFRLPFGLANFLGFGFVIGLIQITLSIIFSAPRRRIEDFVRKSPAWPADRLFGPISQLIVGVTVVSFILALVLTYPVSRPIKNSIKNSRFGEALAQPASTVFKR